MNTKFFIRSLPLTLSLAVSGIVLAAPMGPYVLLGGGGADLDNYTLKSTQVTQTNLTPFLTSYGISYNQHPAFTYAGRAAVGYYFNRNPFTTRAFGLESGFNYFQGKTATVTNSLSVPFITEPFPVSTTEKSSAWSTDLEGVYSQDLIIPNTSLIFKLGIGYMNVTQKITNRVTNLPNQLPAFEKHQENGIGAAGGVGLQYNFSTHVAARVELDGFDGGKNLKDAEGLVGLVYSF